MCLLYQYCQFIASNHLIKMEHKSNCHFVDGNSMKRLKVDVEANGNIPLIIQTACKYIRDNAMNTKGIFHTDASLTEAMLLKEQLKLGNSEDLKACKSVHLVPLMLFTILRDMRQPIISSEIFHQTMLSSDGKISYRIIIVDYLCSMYYRALIFNDNIIFFYLLQWNLKMIWMRIFYLV